MLLKEDTVWSMEQLNRYINNKFKGPRGLPSDWVFTAFTVSVPSPTSCLAGVLGVETP